MKNNFNDCLNRLLKDEGGYSNNPSDPGGPTNFGITLADYRLHINSKGTANDVKNMKLTDAQTIYKVKYWNALNCDNLPNGVDYTCFDYGVNSGLGRPRKALNRFKNVTDPIKLIDAINDERLAFLKSLKTWSVFGKGWGPRVERVRSYSKVLAGKKDVTSGPSSGIILGGGLWLGLSQYIHNHPYLIIVGSLAIAVIVGTIIHILRNKNG